MALASRCGGSGAAGNGTGGAAAGSGGKGGGSGAAGVDTGAGGATGGEAGDGEAGMGTGGTAAGTGGSAGVPATPTFETTVLSMDHVAEGAAVGDIDGDGSLDLVAGPIWYRGPAFDVGGTLFDPVPTFTRDQYSTFFLTFVDDIDADDQLDIVAIGDAGGGNVHDQQARHVFARATLKPVRAPAPPFRGSRWAWRAAAGSG